MLHNRGPGAFHVCGSCISLMLLINISPGFSNPNPSRGGESSHADVKGKGKERAHTIYLDDSDEDGSAEDTVLTKPSDVGDVIQGASFDVEKNHRQKPRPRGSDPNTRGPGTSGSNHGSRRPSLPLQNDISIHVGSEYAERPRPPKRAQAMKGKVGHHGCLLLFGSP